MFRKKKRFFTITAKHDETRIRGGVKNIDENVYVSNRSLVLSYYQSSKEKKSVLMQASKKQNKKTTHTRKKYERNILLEMRKQKGLEEQNLLEGLYRPVALPLL